MGCCTEQILFARTRCCGLTIHLCLSNQKEGEISPEAGSTTFRAVMFDMDPFGEKRFVARSAVHVIIIIIPSPINSRRKVWSMRLSEHPDFVYKSTPLSKHLNVWIHLWISMDISTAASISMDPRVYPCMCPRVLKGEY